jgi:hypothetical protein
MCGSIYASAQTCEDCPGSGPGGNFTSITPLHEMPKAERDSTLLAVSKAALLRYGPGYYKDTHQTVIEDLGVSSIIKDYEGLRLYRVTYIYDKNIELLSLDYAAEVYVRSDNGKVIEINFGNGWGLGKLDTLTDDDNPVMGYAQRHEMGGAIITGISVNYEVTPQGDTLYTRKTDSGLYLPSDKDGNLLPPETGNTLNPGDFGM